MINNFGANAVINAQDPEDARLTCFHYAAKWGHLKLIALLKENGVDNNPEKGIFFKAVTLFQQSLIF